MRNASTADNRIRDAQRELIRAVAASISGLSVNELMQLCEITFARQGWYRKWCANSHHLAEFIVENAFEAKAAVIHVAKEFDAAQFHSSVERLYDSGYEQLYFVCTATLPPFSGPVDDVELFSRDRFADLVIRSGLVNWILDGSTDH